MERLQALAWPLFHLVANILELKSKVILPHDCYGGTFRLFSSLAKKGILEVHFVNQGDESLIKKAIQEIQPRFDMVRDPFQSSLTSCRY